MFNVPLDREELEWVIQAVDIMVEHSNDALKNTYDDPKDREDIEKELETWESLERKLVKILTQN